MFTMTSWQHVFHNVLRVQNVCCAAFPMCKRHHKLLWNVLHTLSFGILLVPERGQELPQGEFVVVWGDAMFWQLYNFRKISSTVPRGALTPGRFSENYRSVPYGTAMFEQLRDFRKIGVVRINVPYHHKRASQHFSAPKKQACRSVYYVFESMLLRIHRER